MRKIAFFSLKIFLIFSFWSIASLADESFKTLEDKNLKPRDTELNVFTGMFDFSDDKQAAGVLGLQHKMKIYGEKVFWENYLQLQEAF